LDAAVAEAIADRLVDAVLPGFELALGEVGAFKRGRLARVVWLGLRSGEVESAALAAAVELECGRAGLESEPRAYHPHLTLARARARDGVALPELAPPPATEGWRAGELILYRSRLGRAGSVYEPLRSITLR
jgi:RNA 2',3'-cyclic 3'-phosphodiesterase